MPRRTLTPATPVPPAIPIAPPRDPSVIAQSDPEWAANLQLLRRQWKWAAFSQFFYTFARLFSMSDVALADIEDDLARSTSIYLPRVMHRLLYTLTQDRKITIDTWQNGLRKQYVRRDPVANPIGPEPPAPSRQPSYIPEEEPEEDETKESSAAGPSGDIAPADASGDAEPSHNGAEDLSKANTEERSRVDESQVASSAPTPSVKKEASPEPEVEGQQESKDWLELPMLTKLDSLYLLTEWQFQNPSRLRSIMKNDDENAKWRIEPIGYDAKTNAYWLIGNDRLWIQRVPPKPRKGTKRKRPMTTKKASTSKAEPEADTAAYESDNPKTAKRRRAPTRVVDGRTSRSQVQQSVEHSLPSGSKSTRAAKLQANKKLDAQAKELAEFQRQAAAAARLSTRASRAKGGSQTAPGRPPPRGTRASTRLRGSTRDDDEWQQVPEEWLQESSDSVEKPPAKKGKGKAVESEKEDEPPEGPEHLKTGLESDSSSDLTELSEDESAPQETAPQPQPQTKGKSANSRKSRSAQAKKGATAAELVATLGAELEEQEPIWEETPWIPADFVEWETICVTLNEWEHIAERFEKSNHYLEKALYKVLSQEVVPNITEALKEIERKRRMEDAIVHRKRSSRIAMKESEKEEARIVAQKKAEEDEKMARAKRLEARAKREEVEREKREQAREQRRLEREERERRAAEKQEREESGSVDVVQRDSSKASKTRVANGTHSTGSVRLSRVATPSGVRSPDWILECEVCHRTGVNLDDGLPMVSCGRCNKWQHITCHDLADQHAGRPRRNWEVQQFFCRACRQRLTNGTAYTTPHQPYMPTQQYSWPPPSDSVTHLQKTGSSSYPRESYPQPSSDLRYVPRQPGENGTGYGQQPYPQKSLPAPTAYARPQQASGLTFAHYQPEQRMFSTSRAIQPVQVPPSWPNRPSSAESIGYNQSQPGSPAVHQPPQFSQYAHAQYSGSQYPRMPAYPQQSTSMPQHQSYGAAVGGTLPASNAAWNAGSNGYHAPSTSATQAAAESLAYMHEMVNGRSAAQGWQPPLNLPSRTNGDLPANYGHGHQDAHPEHHAMGAAPQYHYSSS